MDSLDMQGVVVVVVSTFLSALLVWPTTKLPFVKQFSVATLVAGFSLAYIILIAPRAARLLPGLGLDSLFVIVFPLLLNILLYKYFLPQTKTITLIGASILQAFVVMCIGFAWAFLHLGDLLNTLFPPGTSF